MNREYALKCLEQFLEDEPEPIGLREQPSGDYVEVIALGEGKAKVVSEKYNDGGGSERKSRLVDSAEDLITEIENAIEWLEWDEHDADVLAEMYDVDAE